MKHIVSFSGGKDSTAMLLMMLENNMPIDYILFCDTGKEFDELYDHVNKVEKYIGMPITRLKAEKSFEYYLYEYQCTKSKYGKKKGLGWSSMKSRWCTKYLKNEVVGRFIKDINDEVTQYIGIAFDEPKRIKTDKDKRYPLYEWHITEAQALDYCKSKGFDFGGLYEHFNRLGCWCCPLQNLKDLYSLYKFYPNKWQELLQMEEALYVNAKWDDPSKMMPFNFRNKVSELDERFRAGCIYAKDYKRLVNTENTKKA